jgi:hypothetical protein
MQHKYVAEVQLTVWHGADCTDTVGERSTSAKLSPIKLMDEPPVAAAFICRLWLSTGASNETNCSSEVPTKAAIVTAANDLVWKVRDGVAHARVVALDQLTHVHDLPNRRADGVTDVAPKFKPDMVTLESAVVATFNNVKLTEGLSKVKKLRAVC